MVHFGTWGEKYSATSRLTVHVVVKPPLEKRIAAYPREWPVGDFLDPQTWIGYLSIQDYFISLSDSYEAILMFFVVAMRRIISCC